RVQQVAVELVELHGVLAQRFVQRTAPLDVGADVVVELLRLRVLLAAGDDLQAADDRHARLHHGRKLAAEHRDVAGRDPLAGAAEQRLGLGPNRGRVDALAAQLGADEVLALRRLLALHLDAALVGALPDEELELVAEAGAGGGSANCHGGQSLVTRLISARLVMPFFTFSNADWRRSRTPDSCAAAAICCTLPPARMMAWILSVIGITW